MKFESIVIATGIVVGTAAVVYGLALSDYPQRLFAPMTASAPASAPAPTP
jgi:hypothetical protein